MATQLAGPVYINGNGNGNGMDYANAEPDERFYAKLLALKEQVLAGSHPRFKLTPAQAAVLRAKSGPTATSPFSQRSAGPDHLSLSLGDAHRDSAPSSSQLTPGPNGLATSSFVESAHSVSSSPHLFPSSAPQHRLRLHAPPAVINPVLLEKSPILLQAEAEIKRQRELAAQRESQRQVDPGTHHQTDLAIKRHNLEKLLSQQVDNVKSEDVLPLDPGVAFAKAQEAVGLVSGFASPSPLAQSPSNESFDENSYYSSKANSWSTERSEPQRDQNDPDAMRASDDEDLYEPPPQVSAPSGPSPATISNSHSAVNPGLNELLSQQDWEPQWDDEDDEEGDYEPPAPYAFNGNTQVSSFILPQQNVLPTPHHVNHLSQSAAHARGHQGGPTIIENRIRSPVSIVVNHIQSPAAPQPSRISPLALGKAVQPGPPQFDGQFGYHSLSGTNGLQGEKMDEQNTSAGMERNPKKNTRRPSPGKKRAARMKRREEAAAEAAKKRKRAATPEARDRIHNKKGKRRAMSPFERSPEAYIKPEPISPPIQLGYPENQPSRRSSRNHHDAQEDIGLVSPRTARPGSAYRSSDYGPSPKGYRYAGQDFERIPVQPPAAYRQRDTQDLRRVASLHYARRPVSPVAGEYGAYAHAETRGFEPAPYEVVERPQWRQSAYPEAVPRPLSRYARPARTPSPPRFTEPYIRTHSPALMPPPPPRQIVVDQFGNRYVPEQPVEYRVVPQPSRVEVDPFYHRAGTREPTTRPIRVPDIYEDPYRGMPPPARSRAFTQLPDDGADPRSQRERAYSMRPQDDSPRAAPHRSYASYEAGAERRPPPPRFDEAPPAREYVPRAYSVRPDPPRHEVVPEYAARSGSVQPGGGYARRDMPPPPIPAVHLRESMAPGDGYRYPPPRDTSSLQQHRSRYADEQIRGEQLDEVTRSPYSDGRRVVTYEY
jgi:hypothetical protein